MLLVHGVAILWGPDSHAPDFMEEMDLVMETCKAASVVGADVADWLRPGCPYNVIPMTNELSSSQQLESCVHERLGSMVDVTHSRVSQCVAVVAAVLEAGEVSHLASVQDKDY